MVRARLISSATRVKRGPMLRRILLCGALAFSVGCSAPTTERGGTTETTIDWKPGNWSIVWQDEFDGPAGQAPDTSHWARETGGNGWGNQELQYYTDSSNNVALDGAGNLVITARRESFMGNEF